jgi:VWFA-related protein
MRKALALILSASMLPAAAFAQTPAQIPPQNDDEEVVRITSALVQTDVVVTDKDDNIVSDLKLLDFEVYENGKKQDLKFMEFVSVAGERRTEGTRPAGTGLPESARVERELTARDVRRVIAFVVDDLTIPMQDVVTVRNVIRDFVDNRMEHGDLVAIVRTIGGKGLLQQFTSDKALLRRAIDQIVISSNYYSAYNNPDQQGLTKQDMQVSGGNEGLERAEINNELARNVSDETTRTTRGLMGLATANSVIDSLREVPGRKSLVLFSAGVPVMSSKMTEVSGTAEGVRDVPVETFGGGSSSMNLILMSLNRLRDNAVRSGVVVNTMDPRGLAAQRGVAGFDQTPGQSALGGGNPGFGRGVSNVEQSIIGPGLGAGPNQLSLRTLADATGGVAVVNTNDFKEGLDRVLAYSKGYYVLAYTPQEKFDNKFRKLDVKVRRGGVRVFKYAGYFAREDAAKAPKTKEEQVLAAIRSPLARRDVDVSSNLSLRMTPPKGADLGINLLIDPKTLNFAQADGKYTTTLDVVGFVYDEMGRLRGGFSETINAALTPENYQEAQRTGLTYSAGTQLPAGYYQLKAVVRETGSGNLGSISRYIEVPDLSKGRLTMSSIFLHAVDPANPSQPAPLTALRRLPRKQDLRYTAIVYNAKQSGGQPKLTAQTIISRDDKVIYRSPEQPVTVRGGDAVQSIVVEQIGLPKAAAGRYVLTLVITDTQADKKNQTITRSIDFNLVD